MTAANQHVHSTHMSTALYSLSFQLKVYQLAMKANLRVPPLMADLSIFLHFFGAAEGGASTSWSVSTTVLRTKRTNIQRVLKHLGQLDVSQSFRKPST